MANFVEVKALDYTAAPNELTTKTYHGIQILVNNIPVGRIKAFTPAQLNRTITPVRELSPAGQTGGAFGRVIEQVPGITTDDTYTLQVERTEVWSNEMAIAFGFAADFSDLCDQTRPFTVEERLYKGKELYKSWIYTGCWFSSYNVAQYTADGDAIIVNSATITYTSRR